MSSNTSMYACPKCGNPNTYVERRPDGFCYCPDCQHRWKIGESQPKPTLFNRITQSPEVLAEETVYMDYNYDKQMCGFTTPFIDEMFLIEEQPGKCHEEKYFCARNKAIAATVEKLKEFVE